VNEIFALSFVGSDVFDIKHTQIALTEVHLHISEGNTAVCQKEKLRACELRHNVTQFISSCNLVHGLKLVYVWRQVEFAICCR